MIRNSNEIINELRNLFLAKETEIVPFVGAGTSVILDIKNWHELVKDYHTFVESPIDFDKCLIENNDHLPKVTDIIFEKSGKDLSKYHSYMSKIKPRKANFSSMHSALIDGFDRIITTNYDQSFEKYIEKLNKGRYNILFFPGSLNSIKFQGKAIAYIHGHISQQKFVFREEEYLAAYDQTNEIKEFIRSVIKEYTLLFLGFSFNDIKFRDKLKEIIDEENQQLKKFRNVFGNNFNESSTKKIYVILKESELSLDLNIIQLESYKIDINLLSKYYIKGNGVLKKIPNANIENCFIEMKEKLNEEQYNKFVFHYTEIQNNKTKIQYFNDLDIEIITYKEHPIEVEEMIEKITKSENIFSDNLLFPDKVK